MSKTIKIKKEMEDLIRIEVMALMKNASNK